MALVCLLADMVDVYSLRPDAITTDWSYWRSFPDEVVVMPSGDEYVAAVSSHSTYHYLSVCSSDRYIFALYSGQKMDEPYYTTGSRIRVVSWDRSFSKELELPDRLVSIQLSPDGNTLYGINQTEEGYEIKTYELANSLNS